MRPDLVLLVGLGVVLAGCVVEREGDGVRLARALGVGVRRRRQRRVGARQAHGRHPVRGQHDVRVAVHLPAHTLTLKSDVIATLIILLGLQLKLKEKPFQKFQR